MSILNARIGQSIGFMVAAIILAIAATVLAFIFIVPEKKREKLNAFGKFLHDTCNFKYLVVEKLLQALYIFLTAYSRASLCCSRHRTVHGSAAPVWRL